MKNLVIFLILTVTANVVLAEEPVYFADENLKAAVEAELGITDPNASDMLGLTSLNASSMGIVDLTGLGYATNLIYLQMGYNQIRDISVLSGLSNLFTLHLFGNNISDISALSNLTNLRNLDLYMNNINDISSLLGKTSLYSLELGVNNISDLSPLYGLTALTRLTLNNNDISDISALSSLTNINYLHLQNNNISDISALSSLTNMGILALSSNNINDISALSSLANLERLIIDYNNIVDISSFSGLTSLIVLRLRNNNISDISTLSGLTNLRSLGLENNNISDISALSGMSNLSTLWLSNNPLDCPAYDIYIPMIEDNNPGIYLTYDPRPEYCDYQPDIDVSPLSYDFGDVNLGTSRSVLLTISNIGNGDLTLNSVDFTPDSNSDFAITSAPNLPSVIIPEDSNDVEVTFTPSVDGNSFAVLEIGSDDIDEPIVQVDLIGVGVVVEVPPSEQIEQILEFFDTSVADGNLVGVGPGNSANKKLNALINMFEATSDLIVGEYFEDACEQLVDILKKCDGQVPPPDFVSGEAAEELANMILELMEDLECE